MSGWRGTVIAASVAFLVGCSLGLASGVLMMRFGGPPGLGMHGLFRSGLGGAFQSGHGGLAGRDRWMPMLERELSLNADQRDRISAMLVATRQQHQAQRESLRVEIEHVLTPEQRVKWKEMESRFQRQGRRESPPPLGPAEHP